MIKTKPVLKALLYLFLLLLICCLITLFWLRQEFSRIRTEGAAADYWQSVPVARADPALPHPRECDQHYPEKRAFFGALHVHTAASYDASAFGTTTTVDDAYRFARGESLPLRLRGDPPGSTAPVMQLPSPLDFIAVTDHAEALGEVRLCYDPGSAAHGTLVCRLYRGDLKVPAGDDMQAVLRLATLAIFGQDRSRRVCGEDGSRCRKQAALAWLENQRSTERWHDRSGACDFTTLHGYEYTLAEESANLHRNVIFRSARVPQAVLSAREAPSPESLWRWLDSRCIEGDPECDVLTIPHNSNWSNGRMWFPYSNRALPPAEQGAQAKLRAKLEPLAEVMQTKGDSECRNGIASVIGATDEFCDFEKLRATAEEIEDCNETVGRGGMLLSGCTSRYSFVRYALAAGLRERSRLGVNPFSLGIVAATDTHNGLPAAQSEVRYLGSHGTDRQVRRRLEGRTEVPGGIGAGSPVRYNPGGLAGVYASQNSRGALFDAMKNRETFGTSGPRIVPRMFAGWNLGKLDCQSPDVIRQAYTLGVPMGGELTGPGTDNGPAFLVSASADPGAGLLQRIQIIKVWIDADGHTHQAVHNVAGDPDNGASVDPATCAVSGSGFTQLCANWRDPQFDPQTAAVYYSRVLENPACRWSQWDCIRMAEEERPASCTDPGLPWKIQERAWTSPIWYYPR
ncbi:DUF3604 domain-containing protein [Seongchinamella unica]|uniref:DUF3604 domain-containing protein n=1 Tax=Seongchinamella unica TaxID=2547392 RepID=A0A4R5LP23_9GAMM|nr:DUF3604 domain-containing protein [Seongchinamella unica]TDG12113.1 DUF3604 domain-containing protein [Seongchinamella unica]